PVFPPPQPSPACGGGQGGGVLAQRPALDRHKARAEAFEAGVILVAARLIDRTLAAELGLDRHDRQAVRCGRAIATAFADEVVYDDALRRIGEAAALPPPALLGGAGLVVDDRGDAAHLAQLALHQIEFVAVPHARPWREIGG